MRMPLENLKPLMQCSVCNKPFQPAKVLVLSEENDRSMLHLHCEECGVASLVSVSAGMTGVASVGMLTDLTADDAREMFGKAPISVDQVIEMHNLLKRTHGGIQKLIV
jgi:hypothetical protein